MEARAKAEAAARALREEAERKLNPHEKLDKQRSAEEEERKRAEEMAQKVCVDASG